MKIFITSGGTKVPIDSVRHIGNMSSGKAGSELAKAFLLQGHEVFFFHAKNSRTPFDAIVNISELGGIARLKNLTDAHIEMTPHVLQYNEKTFVTYDDYSNGVVEYIKESHPDIIIATAAVSDYGLAKYEGKLSSTNSLTLNLVPLPKVLPLMKAARPEAKLIGFKLLVNATDEELKTASMKTMACGCDKVAANDLANIKKGIRQYMVYNQWGVGTLINYDVYNGLVEEFIS